MVGIFEKLPNGSVPPLVFTLIPGTDGSWYSAIAVAPIVPTGASRYELKVSLIAVGPFPCLLLPVYANQLVSVPAEKFILAGQDCV